MRRCEAKTTLPPLSIRDRGPVTLARVLCCCVERERAVESARGTEISWYDRE